jgi:hypothetical protein
MLNNKQILSKSIIEANKLKIIKMFLTQVKGKAPDTSVSNIKHDGKGGHWLETQMGIKHNGDNAPDLLGYEMKDATSSKTTFGDWSPNYFIYKDKGNDLTRTDFFHIFGRPNPKKDNRYSWSGEPTPKIGNWNKYGQKLIISQANDIQAVYNYEFDLRVNKAEIIPEDFKSGTIIVAEWSSSNMRARVENKFDKKGWFKCEKNKDGIYTSIAFGDPITFDHWISYVKSGDIIFDTAMYEGNSRNYVQWRASNKFWDGLITSRY